MEPQFNQSSIIEEEKEQNISSSILINKILKNDTEEFKNELTNLINDNFNSFINRIKLTTEKIVEDKIVNFYNGNYNIDETLFNEDGTRYINDALGYFRTINEPNSREWRIKNEALLNSITSNRCFTIKSLNYGYGSKYRSLLLLVFYKNIIISSMCSIRNDGTYACERFIIYKNILPYNCLYLIKYLIIDRSNCDFSGDRITYFGAVFEVNIENLGKEMEKNPQYFVNNCVEFENLCNQEKQNYIEKISILENERKEIEVIKQECNEKMETYHKLQNEYDEFQKEKQKLEEEKKKLQLVKLKLEKMKHKLDEEREEFEKQKAELTETNINLDELLN